MASRVAVDERTINWLPAKVRQLRKQLESIERRFPNSAESRLLPAPSFQLNPVAPAFTPQHEDMHLNMFEGGDQELDEDHKFEETQKPDENKGNLLDGDWKPDEAQTPDENEEPRPDEAREPDESEENRADNDQKPDEALKPDETEECEPVDHLKLDEALKPDENREKGPGGDGRPDEAHKPGEDEGRKPDKHQEPNEGQKPDEGEGRELDEGQKPDEAQEPDESEGRKLDEGQKSDETLKPDENKEGRLRGDLEWLDCRVPWADGYEPILRSMMRLVASYAELGVNPRIAVEESVSNMSAEDKTRFERESGHLVPAGMGLLGPASAGRSSEAPTPAVAAPLMLAPISQRGSVGSSQTPTPTGEGPPRWRGWTTTPARRIEKEQRWEVHHHLRNPQRDGPRV